MNTRHILTPNFTVFCYELEEAFKDGFRIDPENPAGQWSICYEAVLIKDDTVRATVGDIASVQHVVSVAAKKPMGRPVSKGK